MYCCTNHATSTALHMWNETLFSVHNCARPHMNGNSSTKEQFTTKWNGSNHEFHLDIETNRLVITNYSFVKLSFLQNLQKQFGVCQQVGEYWLICFCGSLWTFCDCSVTTTLLMQLLQYYEFNAHRQRGQGEDYSVQYAVNSSEVSAQVAPYKA